MKLELPYPPSVNRMWRNVRGKMLLSAEGRRYRVDVQAVLLTARARRLDGRLQVHVDVYPPDRRRRDIDNLQKAVFDSLQHGGLYEDDSQIDDFRVVRRDVEPGGRLVVTVEQIA